LTTLTGGGPNVNAQVGKEVTQQIVGNQTRTEIGGDQTNTKVATESVEKVTIQEVPPWVIFLLVIGWLLPSPGEIGRWILGWFNLNKQNKEKAIPVFVSVRGPRMVDLR